MNSRRLFPIAAILFMSVLLCACGGGGSSTPAPVPNASPAANVQPIVVDSGPSGANSANVAYTSVTVCVPSTTTCQTIDHVLVDTGSSGLRIVSSVLTPALTLPQQTNGNGQSLAECEQFADGYTWGPLKTADIKIAGEYANSMAIQVIDNSLPVPSSCSSAGASQQTVQDLGANGILGVGLFIYDCGAACVQQALPGNYYVCPTTGCQPVAQALAQQVQNPVASFAADNNGSIIQFPPVAPGGAATVQGSLIFGIATQPNNPLGAAKIYTTDLNTGEFTSVFNNQTYASFVDSGSNAFYFPDTAITACDASQPGFYCPALPLILSATIMGTNGLAGIVSFNVGNAINLSSNFTAFSELAGPSIGGTDPSFDWGLPFFFGRTVYTAIEGRYTSGGPGPYVAF
jgi:Protein of unknown function (DUF3443)